MRMSSSINNTHKTLGALHHLSSFLDWQGLSYLSSFLVLLVVHNKSSHLLVQDLNKGRLDCFYDLNAVLHILNLGYFLSCKKVLACSIIYIRDFFKNTISFIVRKNDTTEIMKYFSQSIFQVQFVAMNCR